MSRLAAVILVWGLISGLAVAQVAPGRKTPVPPGGRAPVPPQKTPVPPSKTVAPSAKSPAAPTATKGAKVPEPEDISLETKDGLSIKATYYPGTAKKEAVPVIMVHGIGGQRGDFHGLGIYLQSLGHAAIAPDLRGHGQSKTQKGPTGAPFTLDADKFNKGALEAMVADVQACKKYLLDKNDAGELNIEKLCVVGAEFGATIAIRWAAFDWAQQPLPAYKLGQDVKALVLLSPQPPYKAVSFREALPYVQTQLAWLIIAGSDDSKSLAEATKLHKQLQIHHPKSGEDTDLFLEEPDTRLSGTKLLADTLRIKQMIGVFIEKRLVKSGVQWQERKGPRN
jgi:pimeloyl-ACP methyl ester carboxylesterase